MASNSERVIHLASGLEIHDLVGGNTDLLEEYLQLYLEFLPQYARYVPVMRLRAEQPAPRDPRFDEHQWLVLRQGQPAGMTTFVYNRLRNVGIGLDLAVRPEERQLDRASQSRLAGLMIREMCKQVERDAAAQGNPTPLGVVVEVEHPALVKRYAEYGFIALPVEYYEPPFIQRALSLVEPAEIEKAGFPRLHLGFFPIEGSGFEPTNLEQLTEIIQALLVDHFGLPGNHWVVQTALDSAGKTIQESPGQ